MRVFILLSLLILIGCQSAVIISNNSDDKNLNNINNANYTNNNVKYTNITNDAISNDSQNNVYYVQNTQRGKVLILKEPIFFDIKIYKCS